MPTRKTLANTMRSMKRSTRHSMSVSHLKSFEFCGQTVSLFFGTDGIGILRCEISFRKLVSLYRQFQQSGRKGVADKRLVLIPHSDHVMNLSGSPARVSLSFAYLDAPTFLTLVHSHPALRSILLSGQLPSWRKS